MGLQEDIHQWNIDAVNLIKRSGARLTPEQENAIGTAFYGISQNAKTSLAWQATSDAHKAILQIWTDGLGHAPPQDLAEQMTAHMTGVGNAVSSGGGGVFGKLASTLGGAASGLAKGVSAAAQISGKAFTDVTQSKAWKIIAVGVGTVGNLALPGIASGISAGMMAASKIGSAASLKDAVIGAARDQLPEGAAQTGFDIGTGIAVHGQGMSEENLKAARDMVPIGPARAGFDSALAIHAGRVTAKQPAPAYLPAEARAAYYASRGLVKVGAPRTMRKAVAKSIAHSPAAKAGLHAAVQRTVPEREMSYLEWAFNQVRAKIVGKPATHVAIHGEYRS